MKTLALFNNKGGVGKTSLAYHLGFMFAELGHRVVLADLDPQANLSSMCLTDERLEEICRPGKLRKPDYAGWRAQARKLMAKK